MTWEEAGLISTDKAVNDILHYSASRAVNTEKLQAIKFVLEYTGPMELNAIWKAGETAVFHHGLNPKLDK